MRRFYNAGTAVMGILGVEARSHFLCGMIALLLFVGARIGRIEYVSFKDSRLSDHGGAVSDSVNLF